MTIIDTPGFDKSFKNRFKKEDKYVNKIVDFLKNEIEYVHVFLISFDGQNTDFNDKVKRALRLLENIFGDQFWKYVMLEATKWSYSGYGEEFRKDLNPPLDEYIWSENLRSNLRNLSKIPVRNIYKLALSKNN